MMTPSNPTTPNGAAPAATPTTAAPATALARVNEPDRYKLAFEPADFQQMTHACELLSQAGIAGCESPPLVLAKVMTGRALGLSFMASVMNVVNIKGTMSLLAKAKLALCLQSPLCEYFRCTESTTEKSTWVCKRVGEPEQTHSYTLEDARRAGLLDRGDDAKAQSMNNWNRNPQAMLRARASSNLADMVFPDVTRGIAATEDMVGEPVRARADEMTGEVVSSVVPNAEKRDWTGEARALTEKIDTITSEMSPAARKPIRDAVTAFIAEAPEPLRSVLGKAYADSPKYAPPAKGATNGSPPAASPASSTATVPATRQPGED